jgi:hypothetical protein
LAVAVVNSSGVSSNNTSASSFVCNRPSGAGDGHLAVAFCAISQPDPETVTSTGWSEVADIYHSTATGFLGHVRVLYKVLGASEPADYTFNLTAGRNGFACAMIALSGIDTSDPFDTTDTNIAAGSHTVPGSMSEQIDVVSTVGTYRNACLAIEQLSGSAATGTRLSTLSGAMGIHGGAGVSMLINPASSGWSTRTAPDAILGMQNLTGALTDIDEDPDSADANWLSAT